jgi:uncharacterized protein involved in exopolysaccharide biosynthesis
MKRTIRFLARLYPSSWRKRYGVEFEALLEEATPSARYAFDVLWGALKMQMTTWRFGRITLACSVAGILLATAVSFVVPVHYVSQAVFTATPADESTRSLLNDLDRNIFSRELLTSIIQEHNLYPRERSRMPLDDVIDNMRRNIRVDFLPLASPENRDTLTFVIQFDYSDRYVAQQVNTELVSHFMEGNVARQLNAARQTDSHSPLRLRLPDLPSLPLRPTEPNRTRLAAEGLFAGLLAGLTFAIVLKSRHGTTVGTS